MSPEQNQQALELAYHSGWITAEQYTAVATALQAMPHLSAIDLLHEQSIIDAGQAEGLRQALQTPPPAVEAAVVQSDTTPTPGVSVVSEQPNVDRSRFPGGYDILQLLRMGFDAGASDIHIGIDATALMRRHGTLQPLYPGAEIITPEQTEALIHSFLNPMQLEALEKNKALDFSYEAPGLARFRSSIVRQRKGLDAVFRIINTQVRTMDELGMPEVLKVLTEYNNGLVLITGTVGCGKSTTLAAMVQEVNTHRKDHIITLEDPIEYVFTSAGCQITQREVHSHTESFAAALRASLREDPDVIMVGEMRDLETIGLAITASETGHLVMATLHTSNAARTLDRVLDAFPIEQQGQIRTMVSESLRGIISQQLIPRLDGQGRVPAFEIMVNTPAVANLIREAKTFQLPGIIQTGKKLGMRMMDDSLMALVEEGVISPHEAYDRAEQKKMFEALIA
ncbi:MAG: type IV pilus twitching motility protein PilT [Methylacidiphilales bacterium]|nr:type IV pilus twitching motility protein PilT [Candidatus Methylacidiphilales bacterium]